MVKNNFLPIEDYFIIGDLRTVALVSKHGSIDWLCLPYFDSPSVFGKLLDPGAGCLAIEMPGYQIDAAYLKDTAILEFRLSSGRAKLSIKDYMVPKKTTKNAPQYLVRQITGIQGSAELKFKFQPKPGYGSEKTKPKVTSREIKLPVENGSLTLHLPRQSSVQAKEDHYLITIPIKAEDTKRLILEYLPEGTTRDYQEVDLEKDTIKFWKSWVKKGRFMDFCRDNLVRSAITLKLLQFYPTGAIVAAPTTSLPEEIGGMRNWDYRYVWIRDATFALYAFTILGYQEEAERFFGFIEKVTQKCAEDDFDVSLMYTIWGEPVPKERSLKHLSGYKNSQPVRVGNAAARQFQLDVYGSLIDAIYFATKENLTDDNKTKRRDLVMELVRKIDQLWQEPDHGIWEARIGTRHYTYSKVMAWVGADRARRLHQTLGFNDADVKICARLEETIKQWIWQNCYEAGKLSQYPDSKEVDATNFLFVLLQFLDKHDPLTREIIDNTAERLSYQKIFVYRYLQPDGLPGEEGAFLLCSFWLISALAILEDVDGAVDLFEKLEKYFKPQGLLAEEIDPASGAFLGNYPQAFSHMGFIMSAYYIDKYAKRKK
ncbi:MAG TPA: glycoside hydrolase family 15 protein [Candidatus Dormibacteraeota bacterium]|nr:glycoside hydrolase family 15 protein [Candidatus Dormibacteraeota bacterium]HVA11452.1 glycoside hydrolase family 15 protein [Candidatus Dormibacteraeota bacterium]